MLCICHVLASAESGHGGVTERLRTLPTAETKHALPPNLQSQNFQSSEMMSGNCWRMVLVTAKISHLVCFAGLHRSVVWDRKLWGLGVHLDK